MTLLANPQQLPVISSKVDLWDAVAIWSLIALVVFEVLHALTKRWQMFSDWCEWFGYLSLALLAFSDYQSHKYRLIQNGLFAENQEAFQKLVSDQSKSISSLQDQLAAANAAVLETSRNTAALRKSTESYAKDIEQLGQKSEVAILALRAEDDDALAFDRLRQYAALSQTDPRQRSAEAAVNNIVLARNSRPWRLNTFQGNTPLEVVLRILGHPEIFRDPGSRRSACDSLSLFPWQSVAHRSVFRQLVTLASSDASMNVREAAYRAYGGILMAHVDLGSITPQQKAEWNWGIRVLDLDALKQDWSRNEHVFPE